MSGSAGPGPKLIFWNRAVSSSMSRSWTGAWTSSRDPAEQVCPAFWMIEFTSTGSAASRSASAKTRMGRQRRARLLPVPGHHVQRAGRQSRFERDPPEVDCGQGCLFGRLEHAAVTGGERRRHGTGADLQWIVPGNDVAGDPERFPEGIDEDVGGDRDRLAVENL